MIDQPSAHIASEFLSDSLRARIDAAFETTALEVESGRLSLDQAKARMRALGLHIVDEIYGPDPSFEDRHRAIADQGGRAAPALDPLAAWQALPPDVQQRIGAAAVAVAIGSLGLNIAIEHADPAAHRPRHVAYSEALSLIYELVTINVLGGDDTTLPPRPDLRPLGITQCRACGCTDDFACDGGCYWFRPDLCSACAEAGRI